MASGGIGNISPFLKNPNLKVGGSTPLVGGITGSQNIAGIPGTTYGAGKAGTPVTSSIKFPSVASSKTASPLSPTPQSSQNNQQNPATANTYSGGQNAYGQTLAGYTPSTQTGPFSTATTGLVNLGQTQPQQYQSAQQQMGQTYGGLVGASATTPQEQAIQNQMTNLGQSFDITNKDVSAYEPGLTMGQVSGQQGALLGAYNTALARLQQQEGLAQTQQQLQQAGLTAAGNVAQQQAGAATTEQQAQQSALAQAAGVTAPTPANIYGFYQPGTGQYQEYPGGAAGGAQAQGALNLGTTYYSTMLPAYNNAKGIVDGTTDNPGLMNFLQSNPDINFSSLNAANFAQQWINNQFSNPKYQELGQYFTELLNTLTPVVGAQGVSNYKQQLVNSMLNPTSQNQSLQQQIQNLMSIAGGKMQTTYQTFSGGQSTGNQSNSSSQGSQTQTNGTSNVNSWNFSID